MKSIEEQVEEHTGLYGGWKEMDGPDSGVGVDYWFVHKSGLEAYVNVDQGEVTISAGEE